MRLKIGDKVLIQKVEFSDWNLNGDMDDYTGKTVTVKNISGFDFIVKEKNGKEHKNMHYGDFANHWIFSKCDISRIVNGSTSLSKYLTNYEN